MHLDTTKSKLSLTIAQLPTQNDTLVVRHEPFTIGAVHGHQVLPWGDLESLNNVARQLNVDVLVFGHKHKFEAFEYDGRFFINPGSATGAYPEFHGGEKNRQVSNCIIIHNIVLLLINNTNLYIFLHRDSTPSFVLLDIKESAIVVFVYHLIDDEVKVEKMEYRKAATSGHF